MGRSEPDVRTPWVRIAGWVVGPAAIVFLVQVILDIGEQAACPPGGGGPCAPYATAPFWGSLLVSVALAIAGLWALVRWARGAWWVGGVYILAGIPVVGVVNGLLFGNTVSFFGQLIFLGVWPVYVALFFLGLVGS